MRLRQWALWLGAFALATTAMFTFRAALDKAHFTLVYLLLVLGASSRAGRTLGLTLSVAAFLCLNFFFVPPYHALTVADPRDWLVLGAFLVTSAVAAQLLSRARSEAATAEQRAAEIDRLSAVGAEALNAGRAEEALATMAEVIRSTLGVSRSEIHLRDEGRHTIRLAAGSGEAPETSGADGAAGLDAQSPGDASEFRVPSGSRLVEWVADSGRPVVERMDGALRVGEAESAGRPIMEMELAGARTLLLPLRVRDRTVGVLRLVHTAGLELDPPRRRFLEAISYYAALGGERVRLVAASENADALRQADTLKDALLASVSHDLRTPLTTIKALAHDIRVEGDERAAIIEDEADRLTRFVADLLDLSRLAGGALRVTAEINAAEDLLGAALQRTSGALNGRSLDARLDPAEPLLLGRFDFVHALRVLVNLIENALKYSPEGSTVEVRVRRDGGSLEFAVADRGPGVAPGERERIFAPFYRPAGSLPDTGSAGLGLSIARRLAEAQSGTVDYVPRDGGGSVFVLRLPAADVGALRESAPGQSL